MAVIDELTKKAAMSQFKMWVAHRLFGEYKSNMRPDLRYEKSETGYRLMFHRFELGTVGVYFNDKHIKLEFSGHDRKLIMKKPR